jgi:hypothetical protein
VPSWEIQYPILQMKMVEDKQNGRAKTISMLTYLILVALMKSDCTFIRNKNWLQQPVYAIAGPRGC